MSEFKNKLITTKGLELLSSALAGGKLEFTRIVMGSGTPSEDVGNIEALVTLQQELPIDKIIRKGSQVTLSATLTNEEIKSEYDWTEIGVYAKGADEIEVLYMYGYTENSSFISKDSLNEKLINITVMVSNVSEVTAVINSSLVYLTLESLEDHNNHENAHPSIKEWVNNLVGGIKLTWEGITGKPDTFPPSKHGHTASEVSGLPKSLPANGGNADTVNGVHFHPNDSSGVKNTDVPYFYAFNGGDDHNCYVKNTSEITVKHAYEAGNADTVDGKHASDFRPATWMPTASQVGALPSNGTATNSNALGGVSLASLRNEIETKGGDLRGKTLYVVGGNLQQNQTYTFSNSKGGVLRLSSYYFEATLSVDGVALIKNERLDKYLIGAAESEYEIFIPFNSSVSLTSNRAGTLFYKVAAYVNK